MLFNSTKLGLLGAVVTLLPLVRSRAMPDAPHRHAVASPTPTGCFPTASPPIPATQPCASGINSFALQIQDCKSASNGKYAKINVSPTDGVARLWFDLACNGQPDCQDPLLTADPTLFYLDANGSAFISPDSPLPAGASLAGQRMQWDQADYILTPYVSQINFALPGSAEEQNKDLIPLACTIGSSHAFTCIVPSMTNHNGQLFGTQPDRQEGSFRARGTELSLSPFKNDWQGICDGGSSGGKCGPYTLAAVPACQPA